MYSTMRQRAYIEDIEKHLGIKYNGSIKRRDADKWIAEFAEANNQWNEDRKVPLRPTGKQVRKIKVLEQETGNIFKGTTLCDASDFIQNNI